MLPNFVVIGAQKAGSTYIMLSLGEHPDVFMPRYEIAFFEDPDYADGLDALKKHFTGVRAERVVGLKRPNLLGRPECPERIHRDLPDAKLMTVLRDPVDRAVSSYFHLMLSGKIPVRGIEEGMRDLLAGRYRERWPVADLVIDYGLYHQHITRYLEYFERDRMLVMLYEDISARPRELLRKTFEFLEIDASYEPQAVDRRPMPGVYSLARQRLIRVMRPLRTKMSSDGSRVEQRTGPIGGTTRRLAQGLDTYVLARLFQARKPKISAELEGMLAERYAADIEALEGLLGRSLESWKR